MKNIGYYNGEYGLIEEVKIPMLDRGIYFGDGIYEATFSIGNKIFEMCIRDRRYREEDN